MADSVFLVVYVVSCCGFSQWFLGIPSRPAPGKKDTGWENNDPVALRTFGWHVKRHRRTIVTEFIS